MENPLASLYEPSSAHSPDYYTPTVQPGTELVTPTIDENHENACDNEEAEVPRIADNDSRYWHAIDGLD
jgi:hypothetical protein